MITILMSVYAKERPDFFDRSLRSLVEQSVPPDDVVLVKDGVLGAALEGVIEKYIQFLPLRVLALEHNIGLAGALNAGLMYADADWIMRFDSDDVCHADRFRIQRELILTGEWDLLGSQVDEFVDDVLFPIRTRRVPLEQMEIVKFSMKRNPFNHMSVCYRRDLALECGGYPAIPFMEDYGLWVKMLARGARAFNSGESLVSARVGNGMVSRRGGGVMFCQSLNFSV